MKALEEKIVQDGFALGTEIVKVDSFLNHQIDTAFMQIIGQEFYQLFAHTHPTKILTMEASGISVAVATAIAFGNIPVVFAKKTAPSTMIEDVYAADVKSFTKGTVSSARVAKKYLTKADQVLIIDDFLAHGEAGLGLISLIEQAGAELLGFGAVIEKEFQGGGARIRAKGCQLESLAVIEKICDGVIYFR